MNTLGAASELAAVNEMLAAIGEDPVEELDNLPPSGNTALTVLRGTSRDFQETGHWFNEDADYVLSPDVDGSVAIPPNILSIDGSSDDVIQRGLFLYDRSARTYTLNREVSCEVILHLQWDELPAVARRYITALATEKFVDGFPGAQAVTEARHRNLARAKAAFDRAVIRNEDLNLLDNETIATLTRRS